ncbi:hypothetical protein ACH5A7_29590 [Streptomyces sp. NPDC018955]|uniref:hypothetical protein n=1 Tax=Streptomyces sp. NPDC018955 TaxID=3365055 RepID=UPI003787A953
MVRFGILTVVCLTVLALLCVVVPTVLAPPGRDPLSVCSALTTGVHERAFEVRRSVFPPQTTCVCPSGVTHDLVPAWWGTTTWGVPAAVTIALLGPARAVRRHGWRPPGRRSPAAAARSARDT